MADNNKINIDIQTTANTAGVDQADASIKRLNGSVSVSTVDQFLQSSADKARVAEFAFYDLEKEIARTGNSGEKLDPLVGAIKRVDNAAKSGGGGVKNLGGFVNQAGFQITDFAVQVQGGTSAITAFSQQFPQLIGSVQQSGVSLGNIRGGLLKLPIDIGSAVSIGAVAIGIGAKLAVDAYQQMRGAQDELTKAQQRSAEQLTFQAQQQKILADQGREEFILGFYKQQTAELDKQVAALGRINELRAAQFSTAEAQAAAAITQAQNTGGNVGAAQANALAVGTNSKVDALNGELANAESAAAKAAEELASANTLLAEFTRRGDQYSDAFKAADATFQAATSANENAKLDLENIRAIAAEKNAQIAATTTAALSDLQKGASDSLTKSASDTLTAIQQKAAETGGELSSNARQAVVDLQKALADGIVKPEEMALVIDTLNQLKAAREGTDREILSGMTALQMSAANTQELIRLVSDLKATVAEQRNQILALSNN